MNGVLDQQSEFKQEAEVSVNKLSLEIEFMESEIEK